MRYVTHARSRVLVVIHSTTNINAGSLHTVALRIWEKRGHQPFANLSTLLVSFGKIRTGCGYSGSEVLRRPFSQLTNAEHRTNPTCLLLERCILLPD
jgi:hypothetical protein